MPCQIKDLLARLHIPDLGCHIHGACSHQKTMRIEGETDDFHFVALEGVVPLAGVGVPDLGGSIEGPRHNLVPIRIVEGHGVDDIFVFFEGEDFSAADGVPDLAGSIVAAGDESVSALVEGAVGEGEEVGPEDLEEAELLFLVLHLLFYQLLDELLQLRFPGLGDEGLFEEDLVDEAVDVGLGGEVEEVDGLRLDLLVLPQVLQDYPWRVVTKEESLQLHI
mmetsp:Transcript_35406/g.34450  ORF Transcript_35406/g.34450 Transcript_35406/m.34450 type:complete len:221 (-) Transcript_35406:19-681(-)